MGNDPKGHRIEVVLERNGASTSVLLALFCCREYALWTSLEKDAIMRAGEGTF